MRAWEAFVVAYATIVPVLDRELGAAGVSLNEFEILTWSARAGGAALDVRSGLTRRALAQRGDPGGRSARTRRPGGALSRRRRQARLHGDAHRGRSRDAPESRERPCAGLREHFLQHLSRTELQQIADALEAILDGEGSSLPPNRAQRLSG